MENTELIEKAIAYIQTQKCRGDVTIGEVADHAGFSTNYFNRIFLAHTGFNVIEYVRFLRLRHAAYLLRTTARDILDIALECGYEAHESFDRAFKKQYNMTPRDYREAMKGTGVKYADVADTTLEARLPYEFPGFRSIPRDEAIDLLLEKDARRFCYAASTIDWNGSTVIADDAGGINFIEADRIGKDIFFTLFSDSMDWLADKILMLQRSGYRVISFMIDRDIPTPELEEKLRTAGVKVSHVKKKPEYIYIGEPYKLENLDEGLEAHLITIDDLPALRRWAEKRGNDWGLERTITLRDVHKADNEFCIGLFRDGELIAASRAALQGAHGLLLNNCVVTTFLDGCQTDTLYEYMYKYTTNEVMKLGYLPFDDALGNTEYGKRIEETGNFTQEDMGFTRSATVYTVIE